MHCIKDPETRTKYSSNHHNPRQYEPFAFHATLSVFANKSISHCAHPQLHSRQAPFILHILIRKYKKAIHYDDHSEWLRMPSNVLLSQGEAPDYHRRASLTSVFGLRRAMSGRLPRQLHRLRVTRISYASSHSDLLPCTPPLLAHLATSVSSFEFKCIPSIALRLYSFHFIYIKTQKSHSL